MPTVEDTVQALDAALDVVTVTLNPALDQTVRLTGLTPGAVNLAERMDFNPGGKGVNVAGCLADYGMSIAVTGLLGREGATMFEAMFAGKQIADRFVRTPGRPRTNIKLVDGGQGQTTDINLPSPQPSDADLLALEETILGLAVPGRWFVLGGSLPTGIAAHFYRRLTHTLRAAGARVALDTSGAPLIASLERHPQFADADSLPELIKPNRHELAVLAGRPLEDEAALLSVIDDLMARGVRYVVVSLGEQGALGLAAVHGNGPREGFRTGVLNVAAGSTVGAGDAFVAGLIASLREGRDWADCGRRATAFAAGKLAHLGPHLPSRATLDSLAAEVLVQTFVR